MCLYWCKVFNKIRFNKILKIPPEIPRYYYDDVIHNLGCLYNVPFKMRRGFQRQYPSLRVYLSRGEHLFLPLSFVNLTQERAVRLRSFLRCFLCRSLTLRFTYRLSLSIYPDVFSTTLLAKKLSVLQRDLLLTINHPCWDCLRCGIPSHVQLWGS